MRLPSYRHKDFPTQIFRKLLTLRLFYENTSTQKAQNEEILQDFTICGLVKIQFSILHAPVGRGGEFERNELGKLFIEIALSDSA